MGIEESREWIGREVEWNRVMLSPVRMMSGRAEKRESRGNGESGEMGVSAVRYLSVRFESGRNANLAGG